MKFGIVIRMKFGTVLKQLQLNIMILPTMHVNASLIDLDLDSGHRRARKQQVLCISSYKVSNQFGWNLVYC